MLNRAATPIEVVAETNHDVKTNDCREASCVRLQVNAPLDAEIRDIELFTTANVPNDSSLHGIREGQD